MTYAHRKMSNKNMTSIISGKLHHVKKGGGRPIRNGTRLQSGQEQIYG